MKSGQLRTSEETKATILEQLRLSTRKGGTDKVKKSVTETGISDASCASVIESLLEMGKQLRKHRAYATEADIQRMLEEELEKHMLRDPINPLIWLRGEHSSFSHNISDKGHCKAVRYIKIHQRKSCIRSSLVS